MVNQMEPFIALQERKLQVLGKCLQVMNEKTLTLVKGNLRGLE